MNFDNNIQGCVGDPNHSKPTELLILESVQAIQQNENNIAMSTWHMAGALNAHLAQDEKVRRKQKKREIISFLTIANDQFSIIKNFDDGTQTIEALTVNLIPDFNIYNLEMMGLEAKQRYYGIHFESSGFWLIGEKTKLREKYLYEGLLKNGVIFSSKIPKNKAMEAIYAFFSPKIYKTKDILKIPALGGWYNQLFLTRETFLFREEEGIPALPVQHKVLVNYENCNIKLEEYFELIKTIADYKNRLLLMLYPVAGILSTILEEEAVKPQVYLNMVILDNISTRILCSFLQIFNRHKLIAGNVELQDVLQVKDDVLILDAYTEKGLSTYKKSQRKKQCESIAEGIINEEFVTQDGYTVCVPSVILNDTVSRKRHAVNIFVGEDFFVETKTGMGQKEDILGITFFHMITFFQENYAEIKKVIRENSTNNSQDVWLQSVFKICDMFWASHGVNMKELAGLSQTISTDNLADDNLLFEENIITDFVKIIRKEISNWYINAKEYGKGKPDEIIYNDEFVWFPKVILDSILAKYGLSSQKLQFLAKLRENKFLIVDDAGLTRKLQVANYRFETYQFKRDLFYLPGAVDIVDLGKEEENNVD